MAGVIVVALGAVLWGGPRPARSGPVNRFVDLPTPVAAGQPESPAGRWVQRAALSAPARALPRPPWTAPSM